jgi:hypothetical protein
MPTGRIFAPVEKLSYIGVCVCRAFGLSFLAADNPRRQLVSKTFSIVMGALAIVGLTLGGIAYASIPDSGDVIHGCYQTNKGDLRVIDNASAQCRNNESRLDWNAQGPPGPAGSSHAFQASVDTAIVHETPTTLVTLEVPTGNYVVFGKTTLFSDPVSASCSLLGGASELDRTSWTNDNTETISVQGTVHLENAATLSLQCATATKSEARNIQLLAITVDAIN